MQQYLLRRLLLIVPTLLILSSMVFAMVRLMPGDVILIQLYESPYFRSEDVEALREKLGLNVPVYVQYPEWLADVFRGDLGRSLWSDKDVTGLIIKHLPITLELGIMAFVMSQSLALIVGIISATRQNSIVDYILRFIAISGLSVPTFWIATLVIVLGAKYLGYLPPLTYVPFFDDPMTNLRQFLLPAAIIAISTFATSVRMVRSSVLEVLRQDYIRTAQAKGLGGYTITSRHVVKNSMLPVVSLQGIQLANLLTGSLIIEIIFNFQGVGYLAYDAVLKRDYTLIQGVTLFFGAVFVFVNLAVDLIYSWLDPRIKFAT